MGNELTTLSNIDVRDIADGTLRIADPETPGLTAEAFFA